MKHLILTAALALALAGSASAAKPRNVLDIKESLTDSAIVFPESFEQNTQRMLEGWYLKNYTTSDDRYARQKDVPVSDEELKKRLSELPTLLEMPFNQVVKTYILNYTSKSRAQVAAILGLSHYYMPIFEQSLEAAGLPQELKYLPVIESGLDPNAVSSAGAAGLWQFMVTPAKALGMDVNSVVDERRDPYLSSEKAAKFLKDLYDTYGDWYLAIAAYNCGPGNVNKALRRAGGDPKQHDFWSIYKFLPEQTRGYVPKFIAANYVMNYYDKHNISPVLATKPLVTDTVAVNKRLHFNQVSEVLNIPVEELRVLNPQFRADIIPATAEHPYYLILPSQQVYAYIVSEEDILAHDAEKYARRESVEPGAPASDVLVETAVAREDEPVAVVAAEEVAEEVPAAASSKNKSKSKSRGSRSTTHKVAAGETINSIADAYGVTAADIKEWNNLRRAAVRTGQQLVIYTDQPAQEVAQNTVPAQPAKTQPAKAQKTKEQPAKAQPAKQQPAKAQPAKQQKAKEQPAAAPAKKDKKAKNDKKTKGATGKKDKKAKKQKTPKNTQYVVREGDSYERIAKRTGVSVEDLRKANPGKKGDVIHPGEKMTVPAKGAKAGKTTKNSKKAAGKSGKSKKKKK